jgi:uncharacterized protein (UPF0335 family)
MTDVTMTAMDVQEQVARIERMQEETRKFAAETRKISRDYALSGWQLVIAGMTAGAALVGATAALIKFFGP